MIVEALCVADAWGFCWIDRDEKTGHLRPIKDHARYVSHWAWLKEKIITGYWTRGKHEILLIFTRGNPVAPAMGDQLPSWVEGEAVIAPSGEHSAKPEVFLDWIDQLWPNTPKIELNRRGPARDGWRAWGLEAEDEAA
jgi:N6-adenosine-specific RNA methylase IME4